MVNKLKAPECIIVNKLRKTYRNTIFMPTVAYVLQSLWDQLKYTENKIMPKKSAQP